MIKLTIAVASYLFGLGCIYKTYSLLISVQTLAQIPTIAIVWFYAASFFFSIASKIAE